MKFDKILKTLTPGTESNFVAQFSEEEAEKNPFCRDFLSFLEYIKNHSPKLTINLHYSYSP